MRASIAMKRLSASIPDKLYDQLEELADIEGRSVSNLVAYLLEHSIDKRYEIYGQPKLAESKFENRPNE